MGKKNTRGKKASILGRKPVAPEKKAILVGFYVRQEVINMVGGMDAARQMAKGYIERVAYPEPENIEA